MNTSRELKFRIWDRDNNGYFEPVFNASQGELSELLITQDGQVIHRTLEGTSLVDHQRGRWIVQQYTGLKDMNEKEIYEGDVVKSKNKIISAVMYANGVYLWCDEPMNYDFDEELCPICPTTTWATVIGNICEGIKPELLEK